MVQQITTRQAILELLKKQRKLSVSELKSYLDITEMAVRKHLIKLEGEHLINSQTVRQPMGRPVIFYSLSESGDRLFPSNYDTMAMELLTDLEDISGMDMIDKLFENREKRLQKKYARKIFQEDSIKEKVRALTDIQNDSGYMAEFKEINDNELELMQYNCPISAVANKYDKPCECELSLFKNVLGTDNIERVACLAKGETSCKYIVRQSHMEKV
ncbi:DeoR family transcriptional regulator [Aquibacillus halophilus]|uniref:DeoR family transcriptional regulator n=1 Tax=Aquibacillus halophilus TaxID=930132 RepID=A0A6A8DHE7_9BACI|nr:metalloregulator ArsR/SmtB family transcription factor [Aquibacillus halophilus]MRH44650.1 DeoR family transcriptional regulator [Aquibacillus halophilus]